MAVNDRDGLLRTLVVGGGGFIGSHLVRLLATTNRSVTVLGRSFSPRHELPATVRYVKGDARDEEATKLLLATSDELIDLAYASVPKTSYVNPVADILDNLPATVSLLRLATQFPLKSVLMVSSGGTVYGHPKTLPIIEDHPLTPISPYGISKLATEKYAEMFHQLDGLPIMIARPSNPYGKGQLGLGQGFIAVALQAAFTGQAVPIFGPRGTVRDYIYIDDLVAGLAAILDHGKPGEIYNIGTGIGTDNASVLDLIDVLSEVDGFRVKREFLAERKFDVSANVLDARRLRSLTDWQAKWTLENGLEQTYLFERRRLLGK